MPPTAWSPPGSGELDGALDHFRATATVDLLNTNHAVVGGTFIGGIHTAACGGTYQLAVQGFGGLGFADGQLTVDPALPPGWNSITYPVRWRGSRLVISVQPVAVEVSADESNAQDVSLRVQGKSIVVSPGGTVTA